MQQTGLNLMAIAIFLMTVSSLLGPLFNLSPFIPAGATFIIMGLITFDTLSWENKGVNLLLEIFASEEEKQRIIYHEAGHFLVAYHLGIPITDYSLTVWESFKKGNKGKIGVVFETENLPEKENLPLTLERLTTVLMAGMEAEKMIYGNIRGGEDDLAQMRQFLVNSGLPNSVFQQKKNWAKLQAKNILLNHQNGYEDLVIALKERKSLEDCYLTINKI
jgi:hypothetical protein